MSHFILRSLVLTCSFVLALPPAWCSLVASARAEEVTVRTSGGCCDLCTCGEKERIPTSPVEPLLPSRCCCYELNWLKPSDPVKVDFDFHFIEIVVPISVWRTSDVVIPRTETTLPTPSRRLHLLHCVWLC